MMGLMKVSDGFIRLTLEKGIDVYDVIQKSYFTDLFAWVIDSKYRVIVSLKEWIKAQVDNPSDVLQMAVTAIPTVNDDDRQMLLILNYVRFKIEYETDHKQYSKSEYWATATETLSSKKGDCECGTILMYALARLKGIPANRLFVWAGDVMENPKGLVFGHSCLFYRPTYFPFNFVPLDWCYYPSNKEMEERHMISLVGKDVYEYSPSGVEDWSRYRSTWFLFNEDVSYTSIRKK